MPVQTFDQAVTTLIRATSPDSGDLDAALDANRLISEHLSDATDVEKNSALDRLAPALLVPGVEHAALLAMTCADIVDRGGNPQIAIDCVLVKVSQAAGELLEFVAASQAHARSVGAVLSDAGALGKFGALIALTKPHYDQAWRGLPFLCQSASAIMNQASEAPAFVRHYPDLLETCQRLSQLGDHKNLSDLKNLVTYLRIYGEFDFALRVLTNPHAPGSFALAACSVLEFDAEKLDRKRRAEALRVLAAALPNEAFSFPAFLTRAAEVLVQNVADVEAILPAYLDRISHTLGLAPEFVQACRDEWAKLPESEPGEATDEQIIAAVRGSIRQKMDYSNQAWASLGSMAQSLTVLLALSAEFRRLAREHPQLERRIESLNEVSENRTLNHVRFLRMIIRVLEGAEVIVLHLEQKRGYRIKISGIINLGQFHILLAGACIGNPAEGLLENESLHPCIVGAARDQPGDALAQRVSPKFDLYGWPALSPDGKLRQDHYLPPGMAPAEIPTLSGARVVLVRSAHNKQTFNANRPILQMRGELQLVQKLSELEFETWLGQIRNASGSQVS
jgi:hypothetical protein